MTPVVWLIRLMIQHLVWPTTLKHQHYSSQGIYPPMNDPWLLSTHSAVNIGDWNIQNTCTIHFGAWSTILASLKQLQPNLEEYRLSLISYVEENPINDLSNMNVSIAINTPPKVARRSQDASLYSFLLSLAISASVFCIKTGFFIFLRDKIK